MTRSTPHLVLGGARSGKSTFAERLIAEFSPPFVYVATSEILDSEMADRIRLHQQRRQSCWETVESPRSLPATLEVLKSRGRPVLVDCLTMWLSNLILESDAQQSLEEPVQDLCRVIQGLEYPLILVSNEVGCGIVPENTLARRFRDLVGHANQRVAAVCSAVTVVVAGLPLLVKGKSTSVQL